MELTEERNRVMNCPSCSTQLSVTHRHDIEIDYCPKCRGVWLDRGELDKIIERSGRYDDDNTGDRRRRFANAEVPPPPPAPRRYDDDDDDDDLRRERYRYPKKKSFWHELFD